MILNPGEGKEAAGERMQWTMLDSVGVSIPKFKHCAEASQESVLFWTDIC